MTNNTRISLGDCNMKTQIYTHGRTLPPFLFIIVLCAGMSISAIATAQQFNAMKDFQVVIDESDKQNITGYLKIATIWGEQLRPPQDLSRGLIHLKDAMNRWTKIRTTMESHVYLNSNKLHELPFLYVTTQDIFEVTKQERENLKNYFDNGGFMVIEDAEPVTEHSMGSASLKQMIRDVIPNTRFAALSNDHPIYHSFFDFTDGPPQGAELGYFDGMTAKKIYYLEGVWYKGRLAAVYSDKGYIIKWNERSNNEPQLKMGVNMVVYALTQVGGMAKPVYK